MQKEFFYDLIKYKPLLYKKIVNEYSKKEARQSSNEITEGFDFLRENSQIKHFLNPEPIDFTWDYISEEQRLALLDEKELEKLAYYFGLSLHGRHVAKIILKDEVLSLKKELGEELYAFAVEKGQYTLLQLAELFSSFDTKLSLYERICLHGQEALKSVSHSWSEEQKQKLPKISTHVSQDMSKLSQKQLDTIFFALKKILIKEITSEWQQCLD